MKDTERYVCQGVVVEACMPRTRRDDGTYGKPDPKLNDDYLALVLRGVTEFPHMILSEGDDVKLIIERTRDLPDRSV